MSDNTHNGGTAVRQAVEESSAKVFNLTAEAHGKSFRQPNEKAFINERLARIGLYSARDAHGALQARKRLAVDAAATTYDKRRAQLVSNLKGCVDEAEAARCRQALQNMTDPVSPDDWEHPHPFSYSYESIQKFMQVGLTTSGWWQPTLLWLGEIFNDDIRQVNNGQADSRFFIPPSQSIPSQAGDTYQPLPINPVRMEIAGSIKHLESWLPLLGKTLNLTDYGFSFVGAAAPDNGEIDALQSLSNTCEIVAWLCRDVQDRLYQAGADLTQSYQHAEEALGQAKYC